MDVNSLAEMTLFHVKKSTGKKNDGIVIGHLVYAMQLLSPSPKFSCSS